MKKKHIIMSIICLVAVLFLVGCFTKQSITVDEFKSNMEGNGLTLNNIKEEYGVYEEVVDANTAILDDKYQVEFYTFTDEVSSQGFYETRINEFVPIESTYKEKYNETGSNYNIYSLTTEDVYVYISRVDKTLLYINVNKEYKDEIKDLIEKLGY